MSRAEVSTLLGLIASYDRRTDLGESAVIAWGQALAGYSLGECTAATLAHAKTSSQPITPAEVIGRVRSARRARMEREVVHRSPPADHERAAQSRRRAMAAIYGQMGWKRSTDHLAALTVACPVAGCLSAAGISCRRTGAGRKGRPESRDLLTNVHPSRAELAHQAAEQATPQPRQETAA